MGVSDSVSAGAITSAVGGDHALKESAKDYRREAIAAMSRSWNDLCDKRLGCISELECQKRGECYVQTVSPQKFNNTLS